MCRLNHAYIIQSNKLYSKSGGMINPRRMRKRVVCVCVCVCVRRGVASIGLRGLEPPPPFVFSLSGLANTVSSIKFARLSPPPPFSYYSKTLACGTKRLYTSAINGSYHETRLKTSTALQWAARYSYLTMAIYGYVHS